MKRYTYKYISHKHSAEIAWFDGEEQIGNIFVPNPSKEEIETFENMTSEDLYNYVKRFQ